MTRYLFPLVLLFSFAAVLVVWLRDDSASDLETIPSAELSVRSVETPDSFIEGQVSLLVDSELHPDPDPVPPAKAESNRSAEVPNLPEGFAGEILIRSEASLPKVEETVSPDDLHLRKMASGFAYVEYKGVIGGRPIASFCVDPKSGKCEVAGEGDTFHEIQIAKVDPESVRVSYRSASPIAKPLVPLEMEFKPMDELTPEERVLRKNRYDELYGNRFREASFEHRKKNGGRVPDPPTPEEQAIAAAAYESTYGEFFRDLNRLKAGEEPGEYPLDAPTLEESVANYFDTYWPDQVEWEVSEEEKNGGE